MRQNESWRNSTSTSHRVAYLTTASLSGGVGLSALYTSRLLTRAVADVPEGRLFTLALFGALLGSFTIVPQWDRMPARARGVVTLLAVAAGYGLFAALSLAASAVLYQIGALLLGLAAAPWFKVLLQANRWIEASKRAGASVRWPSTTWACVLMGLTGGLAGVLTVQGALIPTVAAPGPDPSLAPGMRTAALVTAGLAGLAALALAVLTPSDTDDDQTVSPKRMLVGSLRALRYPYVATVAAAYGLAAGMLGAFDGLWLRALPCSVPIWLPGLLNFGVLSGSVVVLVMAFFGDRATHRNGGGEDFLARHARPLTLLMGAIMALGGGWAAISQHVLGDPTSGIIGNAVFGEIGSTILLPLVDCLYKERFPDGNIRDEANNAANTVKVLGQLGLGAELGATAWAASGWSGVSLVLAGLGMATFTTTAVVYLWPYLAGWRLRFPAARAAPAKAGTPR